MLPSQTKQFLTDFLKILQINFNYSFFHKRAIFFYKPTTSIPTDLAFISKKKNVFYTSSSKSKNYKQPGIFNMLKTREINKHLSWSQSSLFIQKINLF